jgi:phage tail-like protein
MELGVRTTAAASPASAPAVGALRFRVVVAGIEIGRFSRCSGLGFAYDVDDYREGGERAFTHRLRGAVRHSNLTLERGVTDETALLDWFFASHQQHQRRTVTVFLLGDDGRRVRHWAFDGALPLRWQGPELDAGSTGAAVESLEIAHEGLVMTSPGAGARAGAPAPNFQRARLEIEGGGEVTCWLNPREYTITQSSEWPAEGRGSTGPQELTVELVFDAADDPSRSVSDVCTALFGALEPAGDRGRPPTLTFAWGESAPFRAVARRLSVRYVLFRADGEPSRARVELTLVRIELPRTAARARRPGLVAAGTEEASPGGARIHVVIAGESLPSIAYRSYGDAHAWRVIAAANAIDDPTRLEPGTRLEIPETPARAGEARERETWSAGEPLGAGVSLPLRVDRAGGLLLARGSEDVRQAILTVLSTEPGERPMRPEFGCALQQFFFERVDASTLGRIRDEVLRALERWEPRIEVLDVDCDVVDAASGALTINLGYVLTGRAEVRRLSHPISVLPTEETADAA